MKIGITGMSGSGKTTLLNSIPNNANIIKLPEVARNFISSGSMYSEGGYDLKLDSICVANWQNIAIMNSNPNANFITDRTFLDDYALMHLYFNREISLSHIQAEINRINELSGDEYIFDLLIITENSNDRDFLEANVFNDKQRNNSTEYDKYMQTVEDFYKYVNNAVFNLKGLARKVEIRPFGDESISGKYIADLL